MVDYRGPERLAALSNGRLSLADARAALSQTPALHAFERGELTPLAFAEQAVRQWGLDVSPGDFIADFETWPERLLPGARDAIAALDGKYQLACFSNINIPHWRQAETLGLSRLFEKVFLSHELGARKPELRAYDLVINGLNGPAAGVLFFDDVVENVAAARKAGVQARHVDLGGGLLSALSDAGIM